LETYFKEKITSLPERQIKFKLGFHGKNEQNKPDILISLIDKSGKTKKEDKIALEITEIDTSPLSVKEDKGSTHRVFDGEMKKRNFDKAREAKKKLEIINADSYLSNLLANMGNMLLKKNKKNYDCGKTIIWVNLLAYCHVDIEDLTMGKNFCLAYKSREIDEKFFSHFLLKKIKEISKEFRDKGKKMNFDYLIIKFAEADQETMHEGKLYKFVFFVKEILNIPIVSGEIMVEEELKKINDEYKDKLDKLRISPCRVVSN